MKICTKCKIGKGLSEFYKHKITKDGFEHRCKACVKTYRVINIEKIKKRESLHRIVNKERLSASCKAYKESHKEELKAYNASYRETAAYKLTQEKTIAKYPNAKKSRQYYSDHKYKIAIPDQCSECPSIIRVEAHHDDYNKPLDVRFLCKQCHTDWHKTNTPLNRVSGIFVNDELDLHEKVEHIPDVGQMVQPKLEEKR